MSFSVETNRLIELRDLANRTFEERARQQALEQPAKRSGFIMLTALSSRAPVGTVEPDYETSTGRVISHGRPSIRLFGAGSTVAQSWGEPEVEDIADGVSFVIASTAPHMDYLLREIAPHPIPKAGLTALSFWSFRDQEPVLASRVPHPGAGREPFVGDALRERKGMLVSQLKSGMRTVIGPVYRFFR